MYTMHKVHLYERLPVVVVRDHVGPRGVVEVESLHQLVVGSLIDERGQDVHDTAVQQKLEVRAITASEQRLWHNCETLNQS